MIKITALLFLLITPIHLFGELQNKANTQFSNERHDSLLFFIEKAHFKAKLFRLFPKKVTTRGKADGEFLFQRTGRLSYILSELYTEHPVKFSSHPYLQNRYKIDIHWTEETSFEHVRQKVLEKMQSIFDYSIKQEVTQQQYYVLRVKDRHKLQKAVAKANDGVIFKSSVQNGKWEIVAGLNRFVKEMSKLINRKIIYKNSDTSLYQFNLSISAGFESLAKQLETDYGINLQKKEKPVTYYLIKF